MYRFLHVSLQCAKVSEIVFFMKWTYSLFNSLLKLMSYFHNTSISLARLNPSVGHVFDTTAIK